MNDVIDRDKLSVRSRRALAGLGVVTWKQLGSLDFDTLLMAKNVGPMTVKEIVIALAKSLSGEESGASDYGFTRDELAVASMKVVALRMDAVDRNWTPKMLAKTAYEIADAMLAARERKGDPQ